MTLTIHQVGLMYQLGLMQRGGVRAPAIIAIVLTGFSVLTIIMILKPVMTVGDVSTMHRTNPPSRREHPSMSESNLANVVGVLPVTDHAAAVKWYQEWIGRAPDVEPMEGIAEWQLAENAWIQVSVDPEPAGQTTVVVGVKDIDTQRSACAAVDVAVGEVNDYGFVKTAEAVDPAGNKILFTQEVPQD